MVARLALLLSLAIAAPAAALTTLPGTTTVTLRLQGTGDVTIDWGDSSSSTHTLTGSYQDITHTYAAGGEYTFDFTSGAANVTRWEGGTSNYGGTFPSLISLTLLNLHDNNTVADVSALTSLTFLSLGGNNTVSDVSALTSLIDLRLWGNNTVSDVSALTSLTSLTLYGSNTVSDVSSLTSLTYLDLHGNNTVADVSALTSLTFLRLGGNNTVSDVSALTSLTSLGLYGNNTVADVSALISLTSLILHGNNTVSDVSALISLTYLDLLGNNTVSDVPALTSLTFLRLGGNNTVSDVSALTSMTYCQVDNGTRQFIDDTIRFAYTRRNGPNCTYELRFGTASTPTDTARDIADLLESGSLGTASITINTNDPPATDPSPPVPASLVTDGGGALVFDASGLPTVSGVSYWSGQADTQDLLAAELTAGPEPQVLTTDTLSVASGQVSLDTSATFDAHNNGSVTIHRRVLQWRPTGGTDADWEAVDDDWDGSAITPSQGTGEVRSIAIGENTASFSSLSADWAVGSAVSYTAPAVPQRLDPNLTITLDLFP